MDWALLSLFGALALFWFSTRQFQTWMRLAIWLGGIALLSWTAFGIAPKDRFSIVGAFEGALRHGQEAPLIQSLASNAGTVAPFIAQLLDFLVIGACVLAALALLTLTPGEKLERAVRPIILAALGFLSGSVAALGLVAIGFGGYIKPRSYFADASMIEVIDGDSIRIGEYLLRLDGADAPEHNQTCRGLEGVCGDAARSHLAALLRQGVARCQQTLTEQHEHPRDTFGRPLVECWISATNGEAFDLAERMIGDGYAVASGATGRRYRDAEGLARAERRGLMGGCSVTPEVWRSRDRTVRHAFENGEAIDPEHTMGHCDAPHASP